MRQDVADHELYERQRHAGERTRFAGSWTLLAFERLAHPRRPCPVSRRRRPRASAIDPQGREILHLALSRRRAAPSTCCSPSCPSEIFRRLADNQISSTADIPLAAPRRQAVLLSTVARCAITATRSAALTRVRQLIERLLLDARSPPRNAGWRWSSRNGISSRGDPARWPTGSRARTSCWPSCAGSIARRAAPRASQPAHAGRMPAATTASRRCAPGCSRRGRGRPTRAARAAEDWPPSTAHAAGLSTSRR